MTVAGTEAEAKAALGAVDGVDASQCASWLRSGNTGVPFLRPLEPDILGEYLVAKVLKDLQSLPLDLVQATGLTHLTQMLTVLTRATRYESARTALSALLSAELDRFVDEISKTSDLSRGKALAAAFEAVANPDLAKRVIGILPERSISLSDLALRRD